MDRLTGPIDPGTNRPSDGPTDQRPANGRTHRRDRPTQGPTDRPTDQQTDQTTDRPTEIPTGTPSNSSRIPQRIPLIRSGRVKPDPCSRRLAGPLWKSKDPFHQGSSEQNFRSQGKQYTSDLLRKGPRRPQDIKARGGWGLEVRFGSPWNALFPYPDHPQAPGRIPS